MRVILSRTRQLYLLALVFFAGLTFILLHPLIFNNGTQVAGFDFFNYNWNFWWVRHALTTPGLNVYQSDFAMYPAMANYGYHALTLFWYPLWALIEPFAGTLTAINVIIVTACMLNGYVLFVLLRREGVALGLALIGGAALQIAPISRYFYYNTHINLMDWFWLPAQLLLWQQIVRAVAAKRMGRALIWSVVQGVTLWGVLLTDLQFPIFTAFLLAPYVVYTLWQSRRRLRLIAAGLVVVAVTLPLAWFAGPLPYILRFTGTLAPGTVEDRPGIPFPGGFLTMSDTWWEWATPSLGAFITVVALGSFIVAIVRRRRIRDRWLWFWLMLPPLIFALGPTINVAGVDIAMPFHLLYDRTNGMFRMPWRLAPIFIVAALIFAGKSLTPYFRRLAVSRLFIIAAAFLLLALDVRLFAGSPPNGPLQPAPTNYAFYHAIGAETGDPYDSEVILEVPTGAATGEIILGDPRATQLQYYGIIHHKRMINGFISRTPLENFWYMLTDDPMLSWLGQRRYLEPEAVEAQLSDRIFNWHIGYIIIHRDLIGRDSSTVQEIIGYFNALDDLLCPYTVEGDAVVYRTTWHPDGCPARTPPETTPNVYTIDIGSPGDEAYIGWGWHYQEDVSGVTLRWAGAYPQTRVYIDLPPSAYTITISAQAFWQPRQLRLLVNDLPLSDPVTIPVESLHDFTFSIPANAIGDGKHVTLTFDYNATLAPSDVKTSGDTRQLAIAVDTIRFEAQP